MTSPKYVRVLGGPIGGGKSVCCAHDLMLWASKQKPNAQNERKTRFLIVRNTVDQLRSTTMKTVFDWFPPGLVGTWRATEKTLYIDLQPGDGTRILSEWMFIALDTPDDVRKALSLEATGLWGNECRELHPDVVDGLLMRVNRYPSMKDGGASRAGAIFDTNMPAEDSWWQDKMDNPPLNWSIHVQPEAVLPVDDWVEKYGEEPDALIVGESADGVRYAVDPEHDNYDNLPKDYYPNTLQGKTEDFIGVYLRCRYGRNLAGLPVYEKSFKQKHIARQALAPIRSENYPLCIGLDFGRTPAAVIGQLTPHGRVHILSEVLGENMGIQTFISKLLKPHLYERYAGMPCYVAPDPAGWQKTQVGETSPVDVLVKEGFKLVRPFTNDPGMRIEAVETLLLQSSDAGPRVLVDPQGCPVLVKGFKSGYKWKLDKHGDVTASKEPVKNRFSHPHDALQYLACVIDGAIAGIVMRARARHQGSRRKAPAAAAWT